MKRVASRVLAVLALSASLGALGILATRSPASQSSAGPGPAAVAEPAPVPATTAPAVTISAAPALPLPEPLPADAHAPTPAVSLGRLVIPRLGLDADLGEGMTLTAIDRGPSHWPGTAVPGELGNVVVAGHRVTHSKPFEHLDELQPGDEVRFETERGTFTYQVRGVIVVPAAHIGIAAQTAAHTATLFACHPKGSATHRIVAKLRLLDAQGRPADDDAALPPVDAGADPVTGTRLLVRAGDGALTPEPSADPLAGS